MNRSILDPLKFAHGPAMPNRFVLAPLTNLQSNNDGTLGEDEFNWLVMRAEGGFGLTMTCAAYIQPSGKGFPGQLGIWSDAHFMGLERLAKGINAEGGLSAVQLYHAGRRSPPALINGQPRCAWQDDTTGARALSTGEVQELVEDFVVAAMRAERAGFRGVELHAAHGYILEQFLDVERNQRIDGYGGDFEGRTKILFEIIDGIRSRTNPAFQLGIRLSPQRFNMSIGETRKVAQRLIAGGEIDYIDLSLWDVFSEPVEERYRGKPLIAHFTDLERGTTRLGVAGKIMSALDAQACLDHGADFVLIGRGAMLHHDFPKRAAADPAFSAVERPVTRNYLSEQGLGPAFIRYVESSWDGFVVA